MPVIADATKPDGEKQVCGVQVNVSPDAGTIAAFNAHESELATPEVVVNQSVAVVLFLKSVLEAPLKPT